MNITVLGCGRWGSFLAWYSSRLSHAVTLWGRVGSKSLSRLMATGQNDYLSLPSDIHLTDDLSAAVYDAQIVIISIGAQGLRSLLSQVSALDTQKKTFVLCMKGLEIGTGLRLTQIFEQCSVAGQVAVWLGPGHVQSFVQNIPNCMVVDAHSNQVKQEVIQALGSDLIRFYVGTDLIGNELGAAAKNVVGIAAGMLDGLGLTSLKGALMARAPVEIARLIDAMGGSGSSAYGLAHLGDYEATLFSPHSNNLRFGQAFVGNAPFDKLAEGVPTLQALRSLAEKHEVELPICDCLHRILIQGMDARTQINQLFERPIKREF